MDVNYRGDVRGPERKAHPVVNMASAACMHARCIAEISTGKPHPVQRVVQFPQSPAADDVVSDRIIFEIGDVQ